MPTIRPPTQTLDVLGYQSESVGIEGAEPSSTSARFPADGTLTGSLTPGEGHGSEVSPPLKRSLIRVSSRVVVDYP